MTADDPVAAHEATLDVEEVHRAALALDDARSLAVELGHDVLGIAPQQERVGVVPVGGDDLVAFLEGLEEPGRDGLLTGVDVKVAPDLALTEAPLGRLFERSD